MGEPDVRAAPRREPSGGLTVSHPDLEWRETVRGAKPGDRFVRIATHKGFTRVRRGYLVPRPGTGEPTTGVGRGVQRVKPDSVIDAADEVERIDMSPHALRQRMKHGNIYPPERAERALDAFFRERNLIALRDMALRKMAQVCEQDLEEYMHEHHIDAAWSAASE